MTLMDFIQTEIESGTVFDVNEFGIHLGNLQFEDGKLIEPEDFRDYLDHDIEQAIVHHYFGKVAYAMEYEITVYYKDFEEEESELSCKNV